MVKFLQWAFKQPNTWALTFRQYIDWQQAPPGADVSGYTVAVDCFPAALLAGLLLLQLRRWHVHPYCR